MVGETGLMKLGNFLIKYRFVMAREKEEMEGSGGMWCHGIR
jgi:hypothetical protein